MKSEFAHHVPEFDHEYLNLTTHSTEILVPKQEYLIRKHTHTSEKPGNIMSAAAPSPWIAFWALWMIGDYVTTN